VEGNDQIHTSDALSPVPFMFTASKSKVSPRREDVWVNWGIAPYILVAQGGEWWKSHSGRPSVGHLRLHPPSFFIHHCPVIKHYQNFLSQTQSDWNVKENFSLSYQVIAKRTVPSPLLNTRLVKPLSSSLFLIIPFLQPCSHSHLGQSSSFMFAPIMSSRSNQFPL
jgi:hypothetical protein